MGSREKDAPTPIRILHMFWKDGGGQNRLAIATVADASSNGARLETEQEMPVGLPVLCTDLERGYCMAGAVCRCEADNGHFVVALKFD